LTFAEIRDFAFGELGWSLERYRNSTIEEFNKASSGFWRQWERNTAWLTRELVYTIYANNPYIKGHEKPKREDIMKLSMDEIAKEPAKKISKKEIEKIHERLKKL